MVELMGIVDTMQEQTDGRPQAADTTAATAESGVSTDGRGQAVVPAAAVQAATATSTA